MACVVKRLFGGVDIDPKKIYDNDKENCNDSDDNIDDKDANGD